MKVGRITLFLYLLVLVATVDGQELFCKEPNSLETQWDLCDSVSDSRGLFQIKTYKPVYLMLGKVSSNVNRLPQSKNPNRSATEELPYNKAEQMFQLSFKTKIWDDILGDDVGGDIWIGYTQVSYWQIFTPELSRPFRETNYEPEAMLILPLSYRLGSLKSVYTGIGFAHHSNGRSNPYSRSWNRVTAQMGWEGRHTSIVIKPWWRIPEKRREDDNPSIRDYWGRAEMLVAWAKGNHHASVNARHSLHWGNDSRGSILAEYAVDVIDNLKFRVQVFSGYGESLIDYNHHQTVVGFGITLVEWR